MDFSLTTLFVIEDDNTFPSSGTTTALSAGQLGIYDPGYNALTSVTIPSAKYVYLAQGRIENFPKGTKRSDRIYAKNIVEWYKVGAEDTAKVQITDVSSMSFQCDEDITVSLRLFSNYISTGFFNGLTRSVTVKTPCCGCGDDPCDNIDPETVVDALVAKINAEPMLSQYVVAERLGSSTSSSLRIVGKALTKYGQPCDVAAFPWEYDRMYFWTYMHKGPETTQDYITADRCDIPGTITVVQRSSYPYGSSDEIVQLEKNFYSYQTTHKHLFRNPTYNNAFQSYVVDGTYYDMYVIKFKVEEQNTFAPKVPIDSTVIVCIPTASQASTDFSTIMTAYLGSPTDYSITNVSTTTTTSTSSTTTTSTTTLFP